MKTYKGIVTDKTTGKTRIASCYCNNKKEFCSYFRDKDYQIKRNTVKPMHLFNWIVLCTNANNWSYRKIPAGLELPLQDYEITKVQVKSTLANLGFIDRRYA